jgi:hypothetical protein
MTSQLTLALAGAPFFAGSAKGGRGLTCFSVGIWILQFVPLASGRRLCLSVGAPAFMRGRSASAPFASRRILSGSAPKKIPLESRASAVCISAAATIAFRREIFCARKRTVLELAPVYCTSHQSHFFAAAWYRAPCSAKQNLNFRSRLKPGPPAAERSDARLNRAHAFRSSLACPEEARRLRRVAHHSRLPNSNRYTAIRIPRKHNKTNIHSDS